MNLIHSVDDRNVQPRLGFVDILNFFDDRIPLLPGTRPVISCIQKGPHMVIPDRLFNEVPIKRQGLIAGIAVLSFPDDIKSYLRTPITIFTIFIFLELKSPLLLREAERKFVVHLV